ncbi:MAG: hypothetical protein ACI8TX_001635 [Hyphomicrobiaceae bacterium]|jgi:hypothetical protein
MVRRQPQIRRSASARLTLLAALAFMLVVAVAPLASAADGFDDEDTNPLRLAEYVMYPVSTVLEYVVFRPIHFVASHVIPSNDDYRPQDTAGCQRERIGRLCSRD